MSIPDKVGRYEVRGKVDGGGMGTVYKGWDSLFERYVALRRATGAQYEWQEYRLRAFDRYLVATAPRPPLERRILLRYLASLERSGRLAPVRE